MREDLDVTKLRINTVTKLFILMLLYDGPKHGYELIKTLSKTLLFKINPEQVYPFLHKLHKQGLARVVKVLERDKKVYELTEEGREAVEMLLERFSNLIEIAIAPKVNVCAGCGVKIYGDGYVEVIDGKELHFCCKHCAEHYKAMKLKIRK